MKFCLIKFWDVIWIHNYSFHAKNITNELIWRLWSRNQLQTKRRPILIKILFWTPFTGLQPKTHGYLGIQIQSHSYVFKILIKPSMLAKSIVSPWAIHLLKYHSVYDFGDIFWRNIHTYKQSLPVHVIEIKSIIWIAQTLFPFSMTSAELCCFRVTHTYTWKRLYTTCE